MPLYRLYIDTVEAAEKNVAFDVDGSVITEKVIVEYPTQKTIGYYIADNEQDLLDNVIGTARDIYSYEEVPTYYKDLASLQPTKSNVVNKVQQIDVVQEQVNETQQFEFVEKAEKKVENSDTAFELKVANVLNKINTLQPVQITNQDTSFELPTNKLFVSTDFLKAITVDRRIDVINNETKVTLVDDPIVDLNERIKFIQQEQEQIIFVEKTFEETSQLTKEEQVKYEIPEGSTFSDASAVKMVSMFGKV